MKDSPFFVEKKIILWYNRLFCETGNCPGNIMTVPYRDRKNRKYNKRENSL